MCQYIILPRRLRLYFPTVNSGLSRRFSNGVTLYLRRPVAVGFLTTSPASAPWIVVSNVLGILLSLEIPSWRCNAPGFLLSTSPIHWLRFIPLPHV